MKLQKTFSYRLKPTKTQCSFLEQFAGSARYVYNWGLAEIKKALESKTKRPTYFDLTKQLTLLKKSEDTKWLTQVNAQALQQSLRDLEKGLKEFFTQRKINKNRGFPRFKKKGIKDSFRYPQGFKCANGKIYLPNIGWVSYYDSRPIEGTIKQVTVKRDSKNWYIHISCEFEKEITPVPMIYEKAVGIDLGLSHYAYLSNGQIIKNPKFLKNDLKRLQYLCKLLSRKKEGSSNRKKAAQRLAILHQRIKNKRKDFLHKLSTTLIKSHDIIAVENLSINGMIQNRRLSRSIADAGWSILLSMLEYKAKWMGKHLVKIDRFIPSSKQCSSCGVQQAMPLCIRRYLCDSCGLDLDRDFNASINIRAAGLAVLTAYGGKSLDFPVM
jgi:putative transposase